MTSPSPLTSALLGALPGIRHGFFTRAGGVSAGLYESLNVGLGSRDDPALVLENRRLAAAAFGLEPGALCLCDQVHSAQVVVARSGFGHDTPAVDGVVSDTGGLLCAVLTADCAPVLIADADARVVAAAHAGWRGALAGIVESAVAAMLRLGARRERLAAAIGPCIGPQSYEVGQEFLARFETECPQSARFFASGSSPGKFQFDLPGFVLWRLSEAGVNRSEWIGEDTFVAQDRFYSNRRAFKQGQPDYGRLLSVITLVS